MIKLDKVLYKATVKSTGGRENGHAVSNDGIIDVKLAVPKEMGGPGGATNPEQLFASGYSACFLGAIKFVASKESEKVKIPDDASVTAVVGIGPIPNGNGFALQVELQVSLPGVDKAIAQKLVDKAHNEVCPYSNATRGNVEVTVKLL